MTQTLPSNPARVLAQPLFTKSQEISIFVLGILGAAFMMALTWNINRAESVFSETVASASASTLARLDGRSEVLLAKAIHTKIQPCLDDKRRLGLLHHARMIHISDQQTASLGQAAYHDCMASEIAYLRASGSTPSTRAVAAAAGVEPPDFTG